MNTINVIHVKSVLCQPYSQKCNFGKYVQYQSKTLELFIFIVWIK